MGVRIDKYIWATRFFKTRTISTEKVKKKSVKLNGNSIKPSKEVEVGDHINILKNNAVFTFKVKALLQKRVGASRVKEYVSNITPKEEVEKFEMYNTSQSFYRKDGTGKPNKKERRDLKRFLKEEQ